VRLPRAVRVGGGLRSTALAFISTANTIAIPGYTVGDLLAEVPAGPHLTIRFNLYNVTDRVYVRNINNNGGRYNPGPPRSFLVTSAVGF
jgi:catecholate siderophore receptor